MTTLAHHTHWIFDMDGTLTVPVHDFDAIRAELNIDEGQPILEAIAAMPDNAAKKTHAKLHALEMDLAASGVAQPGAAEFLARLQQRNCQLGILTRNAGDIAHATLAAADLARFFDDSAVLARDDCSPKPDPAGILLLMDRWQASANATVMVGDYLFDLEAGKRANVATVHFDTEASYSWPASTDFAVDSYDTLARLLDD